MLLGMDEGTRVEPLIAEGFDLRKAVADCATRGRAIVSPDSGRFGRVC